MIRLRFSTPVLLFALLGSACDSPVAPEGGPQLNPSAGPSHNHITVSFQTSGSGQTGRVGSELDQPLVVRVLRNGVPVTGGTVHWVASKGSLRGQEVTLNANGEARAFWKLGPLVGNHPQIRVRVYVLAAGKRFTANFAATAVLGPDVVVTLNRLPNFFPRNEQRTLKVAVRLPDATPIQSAGVELRCPTLFLGAAFANTSAGGIASFGMTLNVPRGRYGCFANVYHSEGFKEVSFDLRVT